MSEAHSRLEIEAMMLLTWSVSTISMSTTTFSIHLEFYGVETLGHGKPTVRRKGRHSAVTMNGGQQLAHSDVA